MHVADWISAFCLAGVAVGASTHNTSNRVAACEEGSCGDLQLHERPTRQTIAQNVGNRGLIFAGAKIANAALDTVLKILVRHDVIDSTADEDVRDIVGFCERALIYGFTAQSTKDVSFYLAGIGAEAVVRRGEDRVSYHHDFWDLVDEQGHPNQGDFGGRPYLCNHTLGSIVGKGGRNVTTLTEKRGYLLKHLLHYADSNGTLFFQSRTESEADHSRKRDNTYDRYPVFDAEGAGFKYIVKNWDPSSPPASQSDGAQLAHNVCQHYVYNTRDKNYAFYKEFYTNGGWGHEVCLIAETAGFGLNNEWPECLSDHVIDEL